MGEVKLRAYLLCSPGYCQGEKAYICGNNNIFTSPAPLFWSNNHTKIDSLLIEKRVRRVRKGAFRTFPQPHHSLPLDGGGSGWGWLIFCIIKYLQIWPPFVSSHHGRRKIAVEHSLQGHLFFGADFVERILYSAKSLGFEGGEDSNRGYLVTRPVDYCMHQGHKICIFSLNAPSIRAMVGGD